VLSLSDRGHGWVVGIVGSVGVDAGERARLSSFRPCSGGSGPLVGLLGEDRADKPDNRRPVW
jgi:hypothetical protein